MCKGLCTVIKVEVLHESGLEYSGLTLIHHGYLIKCGNTILIAYRGEVDRSLGPFTTGGNRPVSI